MAAGLLAVFIAPAAPASAHAVMTSASPAAGSVIASRPDEVRLTFNESIRIVPGRSQVVAPDGKRIDDGDPRPIHDGLAIRLRAGDRAGGTYVVSYRVISGDSHPVSGSYTFSVGAPSTPAAGAGPVGTDPIVRAAIPVARFAGYLGLVLLIGPAVFLALWYPRRLPRRPLLRLARAGAIATAASTVGALWLQAPAASGAALLNVSPAELREVVLSPFGLILLGRLLALGVAAALIHRLRRRPDRRTGLGLLAAGVAGLVTWPLTGHPVASPNAVLVVAADVVHLGAMGLWLGGLACLWAVLLRRADRRELRVILPSWSRWAMASVYWLVAAGLVQALVQMGGWPALTESTYGRLLLLKVGLVAAVLAVASFSRRLVQRDRPPAQAATAGGTAPTTGGGGNAPAVGDGKTAPAMGGGGTALLERTAPVTAATGRAGLRRAVGIEAGIAALVLAASAVLVQLTPGRTIDVEAQAAARAQGFAATLTSPLYALQLEVFPAAVSEYNSFHAFAYTPEGRPLPVVEWTVTAALPERGIEPMDNPVFTVTGNQGLGNITFPMAGEWKLTITLRVSEFDQATVTAQVPVR